MNKFTITILCLVCFYFLQAQNTYIELEGEEKERIDSTVNVIINNLAEFKTLTPNDTVDLELKKQFLWLFEDRAEVINDFNESNSTLYIQEYSNILSMQLAGATERISYYPHPPKPPLLDSVSYDKLDDIYIVPIQIKKVLNYSLDADNKLIKKRKAINLLITANIYKNDSIATIASIEIDPSEVDLTGCFEARPGDRCDDGDPNTGDDVYDDNCNCRGKLKDCDRVPGGSAKPGTTCVDKNNKSATNCLYQQDCTCKCDRGGILIGVGVLGLLPIQNSTSPYQHRFSPGGGIKFMLNLPKFKKLRLHLGLTYIPYASEFKGTYNSTVNENLTADQFDMTPQSITIKVAEANEQLSYNTIQIPIGVSYNILNLDNTELLIEVSAKPHVKLGTPSYELNATSINYEATYTDLGKTPLILNGNYQTNNEIVDQYLNKTNLADVQLENTANISTPFAIGAGIQVLQKLSRKETKKNSYLGIYIHNNFFLQQPGWGGTNDNIDESDFSQYLVSRVLNKENEQQHILNNGIGALYANETKANFLEFGISYIIKL